MTNPERWSPLHTSHDAVWFRDANRITWWVTERDGLGVPGSRGAHCLVFMSDYAMRRVWQYPNDWRELEPESLEALSWTR